MPKLWTDTIEEHRRAVHDATLDAFAGLMVEHGLASVTMSQLAGAAGIGRATLYKYFPDIESVLVAWHERQIARHLRLLERARDGADGPPLARLEAVLAAFARIQHDHHGPELPVTVLPAAALPAAALPVAVLHRGEHVTAAQNRLHALVSDLVAACVEAGDARADVPPGELASYCLHALGASRDMTSQAAVRRMVSVTLDGLTA